MSKCKECGSHAINHNNHGRDGSDPNLCDVCFWRKRASGFDDVSTTQAEPVVFNGWYCAQCARGVDPSEVSFYETHTVCGRYITDDEPPPQPVQPVFAVNEQMLDALVKTKAWLDAEENPTWSQIFTIDAECAPKLKA